MRLKFYFAILVVIFVPIPACGLGSATTAPDNQATIDAAVAGTGTAQAANQATIDAAVQATTAAQANNEPTAAATATSSPPPEPSPTTATPVPPEVYVTLSEEELAALIDQAVNDAVAATTEYSTAATEATADDTLTQEEVQTLEVYVSGTGEAVAYAEELLAAYYDLYGELATETVDELQAIEAELASMAASAEEISGALLEMEATLAAGAELAEETIAQLESAAQTAGSNAQAVQAQAQAWQASLQTVRDNRATAVGVQPGQAGGDPQAAIQSALEFASAAQEALGDNQISPAELENLAQLGANASAGLNASGIPQLQQLPGVINDITGQMASGNLSQVQAALGELGATAVGAIPPNQIANNPQEAIQLALEFASAGQGALADNQISPAELANLAQLGANASVGLNASGVPQLQQLSGNITNITDQLARGGLADARGGLDQLGASLGSLPEIQKPSLPERPSPSRRN